MDVKCDVASGRKAVIESLMLLLFIAVPVAKVCVLIAVLVSPRGGRTHIRIPDPTVPAEAMWGFVQNASKAIARGFRFTFGPLAEVAGLLHERRVAQRAERIAAYIAQGIEPGQWAWFKALSDLTQALILGTVLGVLVWTILIIVVRQMVQQGFSGRHVANGDRQGTKGNGRGLYRAAALLLVIRTLPPCTSRRPGYPGVAADQRRSAGRLSRAVLRRGFLGVRLTGTGCSQRSSASFSASHEPGLHKDLQSVLEAHLSYLIGDRPKRGIVEPFSPFGRSPF